MTAHIPGWVNMTGTLNPESYDRYRPTYPNELFSAIFEYRQLGKDSRCLEIGIGTGQATEPFLEAGCDVVALEPANNLYDYTREKYIHHDSFSIINKALEDLHPEKHFDLIYAATSFHWVKSNRRMQMLRSLLSPDGAVALFWNHPRPLDPVHADLQKVYALHLPGNPNQNAKPWSETDADEISDEMKSAGFVDVQTMIFQKARHLTTSQYLGLLHTYSNHLDQPDEVRILLIEQLGDIIDMHGGFITIEDTIDLHLGRV